MGASLCKGGDPLDRSVHLNIAEKSSGPASQGEERRVNTTDISVDFESRSSRSSQVLLSATNNRALVEADSPARTAQGTLVGPDMINDGLPPECVSLILSKLEDPRDWSTAAMVCKRWLLMLPGVIGDFFDRGGSVEQLAAGGRERRSRRASRRMADDQRRDLLAGRDITDMRLISISIGSAGQYRFGKLELMDCSNITNLGFAAICKSARGLHSLTLARCKKLSDEGFAELAKCSRLETLRLHSLRITGAALSVVAQSCTGLQELAVTECEGITDASLCQVASSCNKLKRLELNGRVGMSDEVLTALGTSCSTLRNLGLKSVRKITEVGLTKAVGGSSCRILRTLSLNKCSAATDVALMELGKCCKALQTLHLLRCSGFTDAGLQAAASGCGSLLQLMIVDCSGVTNQGLEAVLSRSQILEKLNVSKCSGITDTLATALDATTICPSLKVLELSRLPLGDKGLTAIIRACPFVLELDLTRCKRVSDIGIAAAMGSCGRSLRDLCLRGCPRVTDKSLAHVASSRLKVLVLSGTSVSDSGLSSLARSACGRALISLNLSRCPGITDGCLPLIASNCRSLWQLDVQHCNSVTRRGLKALMAGRFGSKCVVNHSHPSPNQSQQSLVGESLASP